MLTEELDDDSLSYRRAAMKAAPAWRPALAEIFVDRGSGCVRLSGDGSHADLAVVGS